MKKLIGYGYKLGSESLLNALEWYSSIKDLRKSKAEVLEDIKKDKENGAYSKNARPRIFKVTISLE